jgi:hypothetical protein
VPVSTHSRRVLVALSLAAFGAGATLRADAKTRERVSTKFEGILARLAEQLGDASFKDGVTDTCAVKGNRMLCVGESTGTLIDLDDQKVYLLNPKRKDYTVQTFAERKAEADQASTDANTRLHLVPTDASAEVLAPPATRMTIEVELKETGRHKTVFKQDAHEALLTATMRPEGQTLESGGGLVLTLDEWLVPTGPELEDLSRVERAYAQAVYGTAVPLDPQQLAEMNAVFPTFKTLMARAASESDHVGGLVVASTATVETVLSTGQIKEAADEWRREMRQHQPSVIDNGVGGMDHNRAAPNPPAVKPRALALTLSADMLSVDPTALSAEVAIPAGYVPKKSTADQLASNRP